MLQLTGTYYKGKVHLEKIISTDRPLEATVVFEDEVTGTNAKRLKFSNFLLLKTAIKSGRNGTEIFA